MKKRQRLWGALALVAVLAVAVLSACTGSTEYNEEKKRWVARYTNENLVADEGQIVMIGDSIVWLYHDYPDSFAGLGLQVYNRGISGDTSDRMLERLSTNVLNVKPKGVSILIGTNDTGRLEEYETIANIRAAVRVIREQGATVFVQSIYPVKHAVNPAMVGGRDNAQILRYNAQLQVLCEQEGAVYIDMHSVLKDAAGEFDAALTYDGLHPNAAGYARITEVLTRYFRTLVE